MAAVTRAALGVGTGIVGVASGLVVGAWGLVAAAAGLGLALIVARFLSRRLGGLTGDGLGAGVELGVLLAFVSLHHLRIV